MKRTQHCFRSLREADVAGVLDHVQRPTVVRIRSLGEGGFDVHCRGHSCGVSSAGTILLTLAAILSTVKLRCAAL